MGVRLPDGDLIRIPPGKVWSRLPPGRRIPLYSLMYQPFTFSFIFIYLDNFEIDISQLHIPWRLHQYPFHMVRKNLSYGT